MSQEAKSKWSCIKCKVIIPYNPEYSMDNVMCSSCMSYDQADRLLQGYRMPRKRI